MKDRTCVDCGTGISGLHGNARRCIRCRTDGPPRERRSCRDCGTDITDLYLLALRCEACRAPKGFPRRGRLHECVSVSRCYCKEATLAAMGHLGSIDVGKIFGVTAQTINYWRKHYGLPTPPPKPSLGNRKYDTNRNFFAQIDTPAKAYILGFVVADGSVHKSGKSVSIAIKESDAALLEAIAREFNYDGPIGRKVTRHGYGDVDRTLAVLHLCGRKLVEDLGVLGVRANKSHNATFPVVLPHLEPHLVRGLFDGDGWIGDQQFSLVGTDEVVEGTMDAVMRHTGQCLRPYRDAKGFLYAQGARRNRAVMDWMYREAPIVLARKAEAYRLHWA